MARKKRRKFSAEFKAKVVLEALKERVTIAELAQKHDLQTMQISKWKKEFKDNLAQVFEKPKQDSKKKEQAQEAELYEQIGRLKMELEWLKKKNGALQ